MYSALIRKSSGVAMTVNSTARSSPNVSYAHFRIERISLTAAIPLLAMRTWKKEAIRLERWGAVHLITHLGDDGVTALALDKVGNLSRSSLVQRVGTYTAEQEFIRRMEGGTNQEDLPIKCATLSWSYTILSPDGA